MKNILILAICIISSFAQSLEKATVQLYADKGSVAFASGIFVKENLILTCGHLFDVSQEVLILDENKTMRKAKIVFLDNANDVALVKTIDFKSKESFDVHNPNDTIDLDFVVTTDNRGAIFNQFAKKIGFVLFQGQNNLAVKTTTDNFSGQSGSPIVSLQSKKVLGVVIGVHKKEKRFLNVARVDKDLFDRIESESK